MGDAFSILVSLVLSLIVSSLIGVFDLLRLSVSSVGAESPLIISFDT